MRSAAARPRAPFLSMSATIQRPPTVERGDTRRERAGRPPHLHPQEQADEATPAPGVIDLLRAIGGAVGTALGVALAGATWVVGRGAEKLFGGLSALWRGPARSTEEALRVLRGAGLFDAGDWMAGAASARATRRPQPSGPRTLILESDPVKRGYVDRLCREHGHAVSARVDEDLAWDALQENRADVLLVGGSFASALGFCRRVRAHGMGGVVLIVLLDWEGGRAHAEAARAAGADDYVDAPAEPDWLHLRLEAIAEQADRRVAARGAAARQEAMWADLGQRVADARVEQQATEAALRSALADSSGASDRIRSALAEIDRQAAEQAGRLRLLEEAVAALAALAPRGGYPPVIAAVGAESSLRRPIRIPVDAIPSAVPEGRPLTSAEREHLRLVKPGSEEGVAPAAPGVVSSVLGDPVAADDADADETGARLGAGVPFGLRGAVRNALEPLGQRAQHRRIGLGWHVAPEVPESVIGDGGRFAQLLVHIVSHAIRSTEQGEVRVSMRLGTQAASTLVLLGSVADSSAGLAAEEQRRLFEVLGRDEDPVRTVSTAAGLALAGHLVRSMGGQIWFESEADHGTTVRFTMRLGVRFGTARDAGDAVGSLRLPRRQPGGAADTGLDLLLVDDTPEDCADAVRVLEQRGHRVAVASDGPEAIGMALAAPVDAVLVNLRMPGMDGFELAAVLRTLEGRRARRLPIVALTAMLLAGDLERCAAAGIDACLRKPVDGDGVLGIVAGVRANPRRHSVPESA